MHLHASFPLVMQNQHCQNYHIFRLALPQRTNVYYFAQFQFIVNSVFKLFRKINYVCISACSLIVVFFNIALDSCQCGLC